MERSSEFEKDAAFTLLKEGPMSNDKYDPGGLTKFGIAQSRHPEIDVANLTQDGALDIYYQQYYIAMGCDLLPQPIRLAHFECAVNQGPNLAIKLMQQALGVTVDGELGPQTRTAMSSANLETFYSYISLRISSYVAIKDTNNQLYAMDHNGWFRRLAACIVEGAKQQ